MEWVKKRDDWRLPIKSWCKDIEDGALNQAIDLANHPALFRHVALMPDCHQGYGMPIGGVIAANKVVIPNAVGVDIGCGMIAGPTSLLANELDEEIIKKIMGGIRIQIPVGVGKNHKKPQDWSEFDLAPDVEIVYEQLESATHQLGTLGSGNHFIEIQVVDQTFADGIYKKGVVWIMLHSGSRNFGYKIADVYHKKAITLCEKYFSSIPNKDLAFLPLDSVEGDEYIRAMEFALSFAYSNRRRMMKRIEEILYNVAKIKLGAQINIHHNYARMENHFGKNVMIHRKGATSAKNNEYGIIPGSMGTPSYIVKGLGEKESFNSCSHGAGRRMGRAEASRTLTEEECNKAMEGVVYGRWGTDRKGRKDLSEAPQAYKDIEEVIRSETDLVFPVLKLKPVGVVKG